MIVALASKLLVALIVALASKLLVALWRLATTGEVPEGVVRGQRRE
jgi:hypothetical protein